MPATRRRLSHAPFEDSEGSVELPSSVIMQILLRLLLSSVFRSRCISKFCLSLTTSPHFIKDRVDHRTLFREDPPFALLLQHSLDGFLREFFMCSGEPEFKLSSFSLDFLPGSCSNGVQVMGWCEDLLLCCNARIRQTEYFIVNPINHEYFALPPAPWVHPNVLAGLVCKPDSVAEAKMGGALKFRVVRIGIYHQSRIEFTVEIFSSDDGQWHGHLVTLAEGLQTECWMRMGVACDGCLYWQYDGVEIKALSFDAFNPDPANIRVIQARDETLILDSQSYFMGLSQNQLVMSAIFCYTSDMYHEDSHVSIWVLEGGEWQLTKVVPFVRILSMNPRIIHGDSEGRSLCRNLAFHPNKRGVLYLECKGSNHIICCDVNRMTIENVAGYKLNNLFFNSSYAIPFVHPSWPTHIRGGQH